MWRRLGVGLLIASSLALALSVAAGAFPVTVSAILFEGLENIRERDVLKVLPFEVGDDVLESDLKEASQAVYDLGWFREVMPEVEDDGRIVFGVSEFPKIEEIIISGNTNRRPIRLLGIELMRTRIMPTLKIEQILRQHDIKKRKVINRTGLEEGLKDVLAEYNDRGYVLVGVGDVKTDSILEITFLEGRVSGSRVEGLSTIPLDVAEEMVDVPIGEPLLQADIQRVMMALGASVLFENVEVVPEPGLAPDEVILAWTLTERKLIDAPAELDRIELQGVTRIQRDDAYALLGELPEGPIDNYQLLRIVEGLYDRYQEDGYIMTRLSATPSGDGTLTLQVEEGVVSDVLLSGNTRTAQHVILRNLGIKPGDILTRRALQIGYQKLNSFGYFNSIEILPEWAEGSVRLAVIVTETDNLGGMNGTLAVEPSTGGIVGELTVDQKNLFGTGQNVSISYSRGLGGGTEPMTSSWTFGYLTVAAFPGFDSVGFDLYRSMRDIEEEEETKEYITVGGEVTFAYPIGDYTNASISYKHEDERLAGTDDWTPIDSVSFAVTYDDVNDPMFPTDGNRQLLRFEKAGGFASGEEYGKLSIHWIEFTPASSYIFGQLDEAIGIRLMAGWADDALSVTQAFRLGGPMTVRGTEADYVPRMLIGNFEYRVELTEGLAMTGFVDGGINLDSVSLRNVMASTGLEFGVNAAGIIVRLQFIWVLDENLTWLPKFDLGFGAMF